MIDADDKIMRIGITENQMKKGGQPTSMGLQLNYDRGRLNEHCIKAANSCSSRTLTICLSCVLAQYASELITSPPFRVESC